MKEALHLFLVDSGDPILTPAFQRPCLFSPAQPLNGCSQRTSSLFLAESGALMPSSSPVPSVETPHSSRYAPPGFTPPLPHSQRVSSCSGDPREHPNLLKTLPSFSPKTETLLCFWWSPRLMFRVPACSPTSSHSSLQEVPALGVLPTPSPRPQAPGLPLHLLSLPQCSLPSLPSGTLNI